MLAKCVLANPAIIYGGTRILYLVKSCHKQWDDGDLTSLEGGCGE